MARRRRTVFIESLPPQVRVSQSVIANRSRLDLDSYRRSLADLERLHLENVARSTALSDLQDARRFHPEGVFRPARIAPSGRVARVAALSLLSSRQKFVPEPQLLFRETPMERVDRQTSDWNRHMERLDRSPSQQKAVVDCLRRKARREVLHAKKIAGRGGISRKRKRSFFSSVDC